jgi:acetylornithine deacetylase/succinyl-diaminopimelate desuccinylase-like protein
LDEWLTPPFSPTVRDGKLFARGASDDKGQVYCLLKAYQAVLDSRGQPPLNVHFIFEGEEECGGKVIYDLLHREPERTRADAALVCDMSFYGPELPCTPPCAESATPKSPCGLSSGISTPAATEAWLRMR